MRLSRVSQKLPNGVVLGSELGPTFNDSFDRIVGNLFPSFRTVRAESNAALTLTLEVPDGLENETANALHQLAHQLLKGIK